MSRRMKWLLLLVSTLVAAGTIIGLLAFVQAADDGYEIEIPITKKVVGTSIPTGTSGETFTFMLTQITSSNLNSAAVGAGTRVTAPQTKTVKVDSASSKDYTFNFNKFTITNPGVYYFRVEEIAGSTPGWTYDSSLQRLVTVTINDNGGPISLPGFSVGVVPQVDYKIDSGGNSVRYFENSSTGGPYIHAINPQTGYPRSAGFQYGRNGNLSVSRRYTFRYMVDKSNKLVSGTLYCVDRNTGSQSGSNYNPIPDPDVFTNYYRYSKQVMWLARNGFYALGVPKDVKTLTATRRPAMEGVVAAEYETIWVLPEDAKNSSNRLGPNNLQEIKDRFGVGNDLADLRQDEAYMCTQLAIFWFTEGYAAGAGNSLPWTPRPTGTDPTAQMLIKLYDRMVAAANAAIAADGDDVNDEILVSLGLDDHEAVKSGEWYGPVEVKVAQLPRLFTAMENIKVTITPSAGFMVSATRGGSALSGPLVNGDKFYIKVGNAALTSTTQLVTAKATVPSGSIWNAWIFRYGANWSNGGNTNATNSQTYVAYGLYGNPGNLELDAEFKLRYNVSTSNVDGNFTFTNEYKAPEVEIPGVKHVTGSNIPTGKTFTFTLSEVTNGTLPGTVKTNGVVPAALVKTVTTDSTSAKDYNFTFPKISLPAAGDYYFRITESASAGVGWTYDANAARIMKVTVSSTGAVTTTQVAGGSGALEFTNNYGVPEVEIPGNKKVTGTNIPAGKTFTFTLTQVSSVAVNSAEVGAGTRVTPPLATTVTTDASGSAKGYSFKFDKFPIATAGTYYFRVEETASTATGWTYDSTSRRIMIVIVGSNGAVSVTPASGGTLEFTNDYKSPEVEIPGNKKVTGSSIPTGKVFTFTLTQVSSVAVNSAEVGAGTRVTDRKSVV